MLNEIFAGDLVPEIKTISGMHVHGGKNGLHELSAPSQPSSCAQPADFSVTAEMYGEKDAAATRRSLNPDTPLVTGLSSASAA
jgi:hypothetical protein